MPKVVKRPQAEADLDDIWWYIAQDNSAAADRFLDEISEKCWALTQFPKMGISRNECPPYVVCL
jgi:toxin ParE1/3/4